MGHKNGKNNIQDICGIEIPGLFKKDGKVGYEYTVGSNGIFRKVENGIFRGYIKVEGIPSLPEIKSEISLTFQKIPSEILYKIFKFMDGYEDEVYCQVYLDKNNKYFIYVPEQIVGGASVDYKRNQEMELHNKLVAEFHSHPFSAGTTNFSGIDDEDEKAGIIYGVVSGKSEVTLRIKYADQEIKLSLDDVFEGVEIPKEWAKRVKKAVPKYPPFNSQGSLFKSERIGLGGVVYDKWGYPIDTEKVGNDDTEY